MPVTSTPRVRVNLSLVISCLALVVALSGTAYAAGLGRGSVDTRELAKGAVTTKKIDAKAVSAGKLKPGAVGSTTIADGSVGLADLADASVGATEIVEGSVSAAELAPGSVGAGQLANGSVVAGKVEADAVGTDAVADRSIRLHDLGGGLTNQTSTTNNIISIAAGDCTSVRLRTVNPAPAGLFGSMVVGTVTDSTGGAVVSNTGFVLPTLVTETSQGGAVFHLAVCAGSSPQSIPAGSIATWSVIAP
jgi:hypothetical protein